MKINECEINMKVKAKKDISRQIKKGDEVEIRYVEEIQNFIEVDNGEVIVTEIDPKYFEPISKFEIGDKVIWNNTKVEIWGKHFEEDKSEFEYSFKYKKNAWNRGIEYESYLSPLKEIRYVGEIQNFIEVDNGEVIVTEIDPKYFEPISKFEIGDKVIYDSPVGMKKVDIFGYIYCEKDNTWLYAIKLPTNKHVIVREDTLQKEKNIFDLKKGDKFKCKTATGITTGITKRIYKVLAAAKCKRINRVKYFAEEIKGDSIGYVGIFIADDINKIIY